MHLTAFKGTLLIALTQSLLECNVHLVLLIVDICHQFKALHNTTKYEPYKR